MGLPLLSVRRPVSVIMFYFAIVFLGLFSLPHLGVDFLPDLNYPMLSVRIRMPEATPEEIVEFVSRPVEESLGGVNGIKKITSHSRAGLSIITLEFFWGQDMDYASLSVREKIDEIRASLPETAERPQILRLDPSARPILEVAASGIEISRLTDLCRQIVRRRLEQLRGVAFVEIVGGVERQIEVQIDHNKLLTQKIHVNQITAALRGNNLSATGGTVKKGRYRFAIRIDGDFRSLEEIKQTAVTSGGNGTRLILLGDIAHVRYVPKDRESIIHANGQEVLGLLITKEAGSNTVKISQMVQEMLVQISKENPKLQFTVVSQQAKFIKQSIDNVFSTLVWGGILAFLVLFLFLQNLYDLVNIGIVMPISVIGTFLCMHFMGVTLNIISLGGLALGIGMLVDNSIVVLENIFRLKQEGSDWVSAASKGAQEVAMPVMASTLTTSAVFLPVIYLEGIAGQLFRDQSLVVVFSLMVSLVVALSLLPALASRFKGKAQLVEGIKHEVLNDTKPKKEKKENSVTNKISGAMKRVFRARIIYFLELLYSFLHLIRSFFQKMKDSLFRFFDQGFSTLYRVYRRVLIYALDHKRSISVLALLVFLITFWVATRLDRRLLPPLNPDELHFHLELSADATLNQTIEVVKALEGNFLKDPFVERVYSRIGSSEGIFQTQFRNVPYRALIIIQRKASGSVSSKVLIDRLRQNLPRGYQYNGRFESGDLSYTEILGIKGSDFQINVKGASYHQLVALAQSLEKKLSQVPELKDIYISYRPGGTQYRLSIDRYKAALYGIEVSDVVHNLESRIKGIVATQVKEFDRSIDVLVRPDIYQRDSWDDIYHHLLQIDGNLIPLREIIRYQKVRSSDEILREDQEETIHIFASLGDASRQKTISQIQNILSELDMPSTARVNISGQQSEMRKSLTSIRNALFISLMLVYMILAAQFESLREPFLILLAALFGTIGAIWLLTLTGNSINIISGIGFVVLIGIVVNDAIIKVEFIKRARLRGKSTREAILEAGQKRFRPILITTITTVFGLLPMAIVGGSGAELRQAIAVVIVGGLTLATFLTLILIPMAYEAMNSKKLYRNGL